VAYLGQAVIGLDPRSGASPGGWAYFGTLAHGHTLARAAAAAMADTPRFDMAASWAVLVEGNVLVRSRNDA
jgi:hypothetical protein